MPITEIRRRLASAALPQPDGAVLWLDYDTPRNGGPPGWWLQPSVPGSARTGPYQAEDEALADAERRWGPLDWRSA